MLQKLRRQSVRASSITKGKLGLGSNRSRSFVAAAPPGLAPFDQSVSPDSFPWDQRPFASFVLSYYYS